MKVAAKKCCHYLLTTGIVTCYRSCCCCCCCCINIKTQFYVVGVVVAQPIAGTDDGNGAKPKKPYNTSHS